jgi:hypothetical protein
MIFLGNTVTKGPYTLEPYCKVRPPEVMVLVGCVGGEWVLLSAWTALVETWHVKAAVLIITKLSLSTG